MAIELEAPIEMRGETPVGLTSISPPERCLVDKGQQRHSTSSIFLSQEGSLNPYTPGSPPTPKSRRDRSGKLQSTRLTRSATESLVGLEKEKKIHKHTSSDPSKSGVEEALGTFEQPKEFKTKMGFAEQQKWITVQQKTFTKW